MPSAYRISPIQEQHYDTLLAQARDDAEPCIDFLEGFRRRSCDAASTRRQPESLDALD